MPNKSFLMLEGIRGDSTTAPWTGWIPIESVSFDPASRGGVRELVVGAIQGSHSALVANAATKGTPIGRGTIVLVSNGRAYAEFAMTGIFISGFQFAGGSAGPAHETISLAPDTFKATFHEKTAMVNPSILQRGWQVA